MEIYNSWRRSVRKRNNLMRQITVVDEKVDGLEEHIETLGTILGSGCSHHITSVRKWVKDYNEKYS